MSEDKKVAFDREVRRVVYEHATGTGRVPSSAEVGAALGVAADEARASFTRLADAHVLVLQAEGGEILMAAPFAAVPTPFLVESAGLKFYGNCVWDALGIPVVLGRDARVSASCGCCGTAMGLTVRGGALEPAGGVVHFALPAARWWDNVVFT